MTTKDNDAIWHKASTMTREEVIVECREAEGKHEVSDACARAIVRLHCRSAGNLSVAAFVLHGILPLDDEGFPLTENTRSGRTRLWQMVFGGEYSRMSGDDRLMADMLGTYLLEEFK